MEPPAPPPTGPIEAMTARPSGDIVFTLMIASPPAGAAAMRSGTARENAPNTACMMTLQVRLRIPTAAGGSGLTTLPSGRMQRHTSRTPELSKMRGFRV